MNRIENQKHTKETFYYSLSRMFERASFYGFRALVILYMIDETLKMNTTEATSIYGWFAGSIVFSKIFGALIGDLVIGNKKTIIIGAIIQILGTFCLCISSTTGLYIGLFLITLGNGFYTPNIISNFGKLYQNKTKLLDSAFTVFYLAINLGSFFGVLLTGYFGEKYGYNFGFIISGILMLFSLIFILLSKNMAPNTTLKNEIPLNKRVLYISIAFIIVGLFWSIYQISNIRSFKLQTDFREIVSIDILKSMWHSINSAFILPISIIAIIIWTKFYSTQFFKLMIGFIFGAISFCLLFLIPEIPTEQHISLYLFSLFLLGISEIHISPIIHSILTKYSNPKYLAILISLAFFPARLISLGFGLFNEIFYENPTLGLKFGVIAMTVISIGLIGFVLWNKKEANNSFKQNLDNDRF